MYDLWMDDDERGFYASWEEDEMDRDDRTDDEREQDAQDELDREINRAMGDR